MQLHLLVGLLLVQCSGALRMSLTAEAIAADAQSDIAFQYPGRVDNQNPIIVVVGYHRSGTHTMHDFVQTLMGPDTYRMYEPCSVHDEVTYGEGNIGKKTAHQSLAGMCLEDVVNCNFQNFRHFADKKNNDMSKLEKGTCTESARNLKVTTATDMRIVAGLLDKYPRVHVVQMIRDPRAVFGSQKHNIELEEDRDDAISMCKQMEANRDVQHDHLHKIWFRDFVTDPTSTLTDLAENLGYTFQGRQEEFVVKHFSSPECVEKHCAQKCTCRQDSKAELSKWTKELDQEEMAMFKKERTCMPFFEEEQDL